MSLAVPGVKVSPWYIGAAGRARPIQEHPGARNDCLRQYTRKCSEMQRAWVAGSRSDSIGGEG
jgi:hypothetical protein